LLNIYVQNLLSIKYSKVDAGAKLETGVSVLTIVPTDEDNEAYYTCQAINEANTQRPTNVTVQLNVLRE